MEVRLRKKGFVRKPYVHGVRDYQKVLNFVVDKGWIDKAVVCTAKGCSDLCTGFCPDDSGNCLFQSFGAFRTECNRGKL